MSPEPKPRTAYWCSAGRLEDGRRVWILFRERIQDMEDTGWTIRAADEERKGPERLAYRLPGERFWKPWDAHYRIEVLERKREEVPEPEATAILLMTKNNPERRV